MQLKVKQLLCGFLTCLSLLVCSFHLQAQGTPDSVQTDTTVLQEQVIRMDTSLTNAQPPILSLPFEDPLPNLYNINLPENTIEVTWDSVDTYTSRRTVFGEPVGMPYRMDSEAYARRHREHAKKENWKTLSEEYEMQAESDRGLLDFSFDIPGAEESAFSSIFGRPEVNLRVNGTADMNLGVSIQNTENPEIPPDQQTQVDPTFDQNLQLNIQGNIGDKLTIQTDWDTENPFDFQNRLNIAYNGYEDEILQQLEMGNVSMETGNTLIRGGSSLFGIKSVAQVGSLRLTSVLSQQKGERNTETITGGSQEQDISLSPTDYEEDRHFFLDFFLRQEFEENMSDPQQLEQALQFSEVNVWLLRESSRASEGERQAIALTDLGVIENEDGTFAPPDEDQDLFDDALLDQFRDASTGVSSGDFDVEAEDFTEGYFEPLQEGTDYEINRTLGFISLNRDLGSRQALAVSFKYRDPQTGETVDVGEVNQGSGDRIYLKLLRPQNQTTGGKAWNLMMKNIYSLGVSDLREDNLELEVNYTEPNVPQNNLPERTTTMLQDLGLDRVDQQGSEDPDNRVDFSTGTLDPISGRVIFPYLEPFGARIRELLETTSLSEEEIENLTFSELYNERKANAAQRSVNNFYAVEGNARGSVSSDYSLGISLVEGSVRVYANGRELQENTDYVVDYTIGNITILNEQYLARGQEIRIEYENNQLTEIEQKTFTGLRAEYSVSDDIQLGSTYFRLKERPLQDKIRIGEESINNSVFGFDASGDFDLPWLTRAINSLPLLQTDEPSRLNISGEFAQLRPGVSQTNAIEDAIRQNRLFDDEEDGLVFIDDFEGVDVKLGLLNPTRWNLAAAPAAVPGYTPDEPIFEEGSDQAPAESLQDKVARSDLRSKFSWYTIPQNITDILGEVEETPESEPVQVTDVFPNRDVLSEENFINTLDIFYDPRERGPYNYNPDMRDLLEDNPDRTWGGMTATLPSGQEDLTENNIEFLEFWVQPVLPGGEEPSAEDLQAYDGKIYIDIGTVSEDVVPNFRSNSEDGLARRPDDLEVDNSANPRSFIPVPPPPPEGQFSNENRELEDVGLDGASSSNGIPNRDERSLFNFFVEEMRAEYGSNSTAFSEIARDPSNDDYVFYGEDQVENRPLHERFHRMFGYHEGNSPRNEGDKRAVTNRPDTEGLINASNVEQNNSYFQYEIDWNPADADGLEAAEPGTFIVDQVPGARQQDRWYQVRIPLEEWVRRVGNIENFQNISYIRVWMSGYERPFTMRFATFEFLGSQWREAENIQENEDSQADLNISSVNIEENSLRRPFPYRLPGGAIRARDRTRQRQTISNEQSLAFQVQNLGPQEMKMAKRIYPGGLDMIHYSNLRMFVHGEGYENREELELVMRFGNDLENNYYEYRQPITPSDPNFPFSDQPLSDLSDAEREQEAEAIWLYDQNSVNILLSAFNRLKQLRDQQGVNGSDVFERGDLLENAPSGAVVAIRGNPSLDRVGEIGMGVRNPFDPDTPDEGSPNVDAQVWLNELRVSGFDNRNGWAANSRAELKLADFATLNANLNRETDGFGSLDSGLGQRRMSDVWGYDLNSSVNLHKLLPERFGWNIPVSVSTRRSTSTPRFLPNQGDIRLSEFVDAINAREDISQEQKRAQIDRVTRESQTYSESYSINLSNVTKTMSQNWLARQILDNTNFNFVYNETDRRNPEYRFQNDWNFSTSLRYELDFERTRLVQPFAFTGGVPLLGALSGLSLGYTPAEINTSVGMDRDYDERRRQVAGGVEMAPLRQSHTFDYNTTFGLDYNLTPVIRTGFRSRTVFDLSNRGVEPLRNVSEADSGAYRTRPTFDVLNDLVTDTLSSRRSNYNETYTAGWQPRFNNINWLDWFDYSANYNGGYQWRNSPSGSNLGANISNSLNLSQGADLDVRDLMERMPWYENLRQADLQNGNDARLPQQDTTAAGYTEEIFADDIKTVGRKLLLAVLSLESVDVSFDKSRQTQQAGYAGDSQIYYMFKQGSPTYSPPFSYRTGLTHDIGRSQLIQNNTQDRSIQLPGNRNLTDDLTFGAQFRPFRNLSVDLTWRTQWDERNTNALTLDTQNVFSSVRNQNGEIRSSVWAFGEGYADLFRRQLQTAFDDITAENDNLSDETGNNDGRSVLGRRTLQDDFRRAYLGTESDAIGERNLTPFPRPEWDITWSGIEQFIPFMGSLMTRASLSHSYEGLYRTGWVFNADTGPLNPIGIGTYTVTNNRPEYEPNAVNIEKIFSPLLGLNITWESDLRTNIQYDWSKVTSLALSNSIVTERFSRGLRVAFSYTIRDFKLPLFPRIRNAVDLTLNGSLLEDTEQRFLLNSDLDDALQDGPEVITKNTDLYDFSPNPTTGQSRINGSAVVGYRFSQMIKANFEYGYNRLLPKSSGVYARTDHDIRFNVVVSIRSE